ncbi:MAG TPA: DUF2807 domain-containing protein, partial [Myxococcota bacterium]|nr:DUF2807 domain-containing protein [Myxococcota bacterium]
MSANRSIPAAILAALVALGAAAADHRESRPAAGFHAIALAVPIEVEVTQGANEAVVLEGEAAALAEIETVVEDGTLEIRLRREARGWRGPRWLSRGVRAYVTAPRVEALAVSGSGEIRAPALRGDSLRVSIAGSGDVRVAGAVRELVARVAGSGDLRAAGLDCDTVTVS